MYKICCLEFYLFQIACIFKQILIFFQQCVTKKLANLFPLARLQSSHASKGQSLYIMISLSRFSIPRQHCHKLITCNEENLLNFNL
jgi:hypothetical protein